MELWDVYDIDRNKTGKRIVRGKDTLGKGEYHMTVHIVIFSTDGKMLIQQRVDNKDTWPSMWDVTAGGAVTAGEDSRTGAERELMEELGIYHDFTDVRPHFTIHHKLGFGDCYILIKDIDLSTLTLQPTEVKAARYATLDEILRMMNEGTFIPYHESFVRLLFDLRAGYGAHR